MDNTKKKLEWYNVGNIVVNLIIIVICLVILVTQALANKEGWMFTGSVINHNSIYFLILIYFALLKTHFGKKYFNYLNIFLLFIYSLASVTSLLTTIQSFSINTFLGFIINLYFVVYLLHTMFRDTFIWKDYKLDYSPFNEIENDWFYYGLLVLVVVNLSVNLISTEVLRGVLLSLLDSGYYLLFGRYIYLYREYLDKHGINVDNSGNFDQIKEVVSEKIEDVKEEVSEKIEDVKEEVNKIIKSDDNKDIQVVPSEEVSDNKKEVKKTEKKTTTVKKTRKKKGEE
ncbi:MAG: YtxH domain-containing protein [Bacilli bacterium]|nr:YtxH domain-containing protein [Bacilli bacterium]